MTIGSATRTGRADCVSAFEDAQRSRKAGKLLSAEDNAAICASLTCPSWMRTSCSGWLEGLQSAVPSVVVRVIDDQGKDVEHAKVQVDGRPRAETVDGLPLRLDPGPHQVRIDGPCSLEERVVLVEGERGRIVRLECPRTRSPGSLVVDVTGTDGCLTTAARISIDGKDAYRPAVPIAVDAGEHLVAVAISGAPVREKRVEIRGSHRVSISFAEGGVSCAPPKRRVPLATYVGAGFGVLALGTGVAFEAAAWSRKPSFDRCRAAGGCSGEDVDGWQRTFLVGDLLLGAGTVALGLAAYHFFTRPLAAASTTSH
ncbi:MAG TPA: hypothetical protein VLT33_13050 [Labilithrix sp.]|nr:hypothetical protein [Labilithrix sp.]